MTVFNDRRYQRVAPLLQCSVVARREVGNGRTYIQMVFEGQRGGRGSSTQPVHDFEAGAKQALDIVREIRKQKRKIGGSERVIELGKVLPGQRIFQCRRSFFNLIVITGGKVQFFQIGFAQG